MMTKELDKQHLSQVGAANKRDDRIIPRNKHGYKEKWNILKQGL